jgi:hypothetical protein
MAERTREVPEQVRKFAPKHRGGAAAGDPTDMAGHALVAMLQQAAQVSNEHRHHARSLVEKLHAELRAVEDRVRQLEAEVEFHRDRAVCGEAWLQRIQQEVEENLMPTRESRPPRT